MTTIDPNSAAPVPTAASQQSAAGTPSAVPQGKAEILAAQQAAESGSAVLFSDTITIHDQEMPVDIVATTEDGKVYLEIIIRNPGSPILPPPNRSITSDDSSGATSAAGGAESVPEENSYFNGASTVALQSAFNAMMRGLQSQKRLDKQIELQLAQVFLQISLDSAKLTVELGHMRQQEHLFKALVAIGVGIASAGASAFMPIAMKTSGAAGMATMEFTKGAFNALGEGVSAFYAVPQATLEAQKQVKDAVNQLILSSKEAAAQAAREGQDELNRILQQLTDILSKFKDAMKLVQG